MTAPALAAAQAGLRILRYAGIDPQEEQNNPLFHDAVVVARGQLIAAWLLAEQTWRGDALEDALLDIAACRQERCQHGQYHRIARAALGETGA